MNIYKYLIVILIIGLMTSPPAIFAQGSEAKAQVNAAFQASRVKLKAGDIAAALKSSEEAYELSKTAYGQDDVTTAVLELNYANLLLLVGSSADALPLLRHARSIYEKNYGPDAYELVQVLVALGEAEWNSKKVDIVKRALALQKKHRPDDQLAYAKIAKKTGGYLATEYSLKQDAIPILEEALAIIEAEHGKKSEQLVPVLMSLGDAHATYGKGQKQKQYFRRALKVVERSGDELKYAEHLHTAGIRMLQQAASNDARKYLTKAEKIYRERLGASHAKTGMVLLSLARFDVAADRYDRAEENLLKAVGVLEQDDSYRRHELLAMTLLVETYEELGKRDEATTYCRAIGRYQPWTDNQNYKPIYKKPPVYPPNAVAAGDEGYVVLEYAVTENGLIESPRVVARDGREEFEAAAFEAIESFRYAPRYVDGDPVRTEGVRNKFTFSTVNR